MHAKLKQLKQQKGFTIIEVLIVLAIAGLIILIVFLAVPALQRNSRNTQRKNDASRLSSLINEYVSNNNGKLPTGFGNTSGKLDLSSTSFTTMNDPSDGDIVVGDGTKGTLDTLKINTNATCKNGAVTGGGGARSYTISYQIETSGAPQDQCI